MAEIKELSASVAAKIAAGEVIERPASVIKELVENAIDALAKHITVEIRHGGITFMRVTDDGKGMASEDVPMAFLRHATSKIETSEDLEEIVTLGFRGEALYSIAAVAKVELVTKRAQDSEGTRATVSGGSTPQVIPAGCPDGTTVIVRDLFFNTPARMKFLKRDSTEAGYIEDIVRKIALARPDISFRFISGGKEEFFTLGDNQLMHTASALYGREYADAMLPVEYSAEGVSVTGLIGKSMLTRPNRTFQVFFVNGRCVMNKAFYAAISEAYKGQVMNGRFPVCILHLNIDPVLCDVNVHPSKAEIKFADDKPIFDAIYWATKNTLYAVRDTRALQLEEKAKSAAYIKPAARTVTIPDAVQEEILPPTRPMPAETQPPKAPDPTSLWEQAAKAYRAKEKTEKTVTVKRESTPISGMDERNKEPFLSPAPIMAEAGAAGTPIDVPLPSALTASVPAFRVIGQAFETYIIAQSADKLFLIDQHAAHERILYNALLAAIQEKGIDSQMLLMPVTVQLSPAEMAVFAEHTAVLEKSGFEAEEFGRNTVKISMIPTALADCDIRAAFIEVLDRLAASKRDIKTDAESYALYGIACKAALKAGKQLTLPEQEALVKEALALEGMATCPHGRPIILSLTKKEMEKQFRRIV